MRHVVDRRTSAAGSGRERGKRREQRERRVGHLPPAGGVGEALGLDAVHERREARLVLGHVADAHAPAQRAVVGHGGLALVRVQAAPAELVEPAQRGDDEGRQHVEHVVVADPVAAVHLVHAPDRGAGVGVVEAAVDGGAEQQHRVVVALLRVRGELAGARQELAHRRHRVGAEQREPERLPHVPRELDRRGDLVDLLGLGGVRGVEGGDAAQPVEAVHGASPGNVRAIIFGCPRT